MKKLIILAVLLLSFAVPAALANSTTQSKAVSVCDTGHVHFAKTKFVFHAGLAFGAFHHFIYKPFKAGAFNQSAPGHVKAEVKAALAAAFVYHELHEACKDANSSDTLRPLLTPLNAVVSGVNDLVAKLKSGKASTTDLSGVSSAVDGLGGKSAGLGVAIKDLSGFNG